MTGIDNKDNKFLWKAYPALERKFAFISTTLVIIAISILLYISFQSLFWSVFSVVILIISLNRFYFPSVYTIDSKEIIAKYFFRKQRYLWKNIRRFNYTKYGGYLSGRKQPSRLDAFRGMHILFGSHRDDIISKIQTYLNKSDTH